MLRWIALLVGRVLRALARARGGGSAFPGLVALRIYPQLLSDSLGRIPRGVVFVTGSNGKSTTTSMLVAVLRSHGLTVFTNPAGSNLPQGLASAVIADATLRGEIDADIAVLEVDEAYGPVISESVRPDFLLVTNLQLDQLNRFGEPERVWQMMRTVAERTSQTVLVNDREPALLALSSGLEGRHSITVSVDQAVLDAHPHGLVEARLSDERGHTPVTVEPELTLTQSSGASAIVAESSGQTRTLALPAPGLHWAVDATLALGMARYLMGTDWAWDLAGAAFDRLPPVYGRGESVNYLGREFRLLMQKNLPSMQVNIDVLPSEPELVWIAVDEGTPDPSWIFDLALGGLTRVEVLTGTKAWQWATFLGYREVAVGEVIEDTAQAMNRLASQELAPGKPVWAIVNYEQMMSMRRIAGLRDLEARA